MLDYFTAHASDFHSQASSWDGPCVNIDLSRAKQWQANTRYLWRDRWKNTDIYWTGQTNITSSCSMEIGIRSCLSLIQSRILKSWILNPQLHSISFIYKAHLSSSMTNMRDGRRSTEDCCSSEWREHRIWFPNPKEQRRIICSKWQSNRYLWTRTSNSFRSGSDVDNCD